MTTLLGWIIFVAVVAGLVYVAWHKKEGPDY